MDLVTLGLILFIGLAAGLVALRQARAGLSREALPEDVRHFEAHYEPRGFKVLSVRRLGTIRVRSMRRDGPVRTYALDLELPDGRRETRRRGVARSEMGDHQIWRLKANGKVEQMF